MAAVGAIPAVRAERSSAGEILPMAPNTLTRSRSGATLIETMVTVAITGFAMTSIYIGSIAVQKSFRAAQMYSTTQAGQLRVIDYVALDLRRAVDWTPVGNEVRMKIPNFYDNTNPEKPIPRHPRVSKNGEVYYGTSPADLIDIRYYTVERTNSAGRRVNDVCRAVTSGGKTTDTVLVTGAEEFKPVYQQSDTKRQVVYTKISFPPVFRPFINSGDVYKDGTTTFATTMVRNKR